MRKRELERKKKDSSSTQITTHEHCIHCIGTVKLKPVHVCFKAFRMKREQLVQMQNSRNQYPCALFRMPFGSLPGDIFCLSIQLFGTFLVRICNKLFFFKIQLLSYETKKRMKWTIAWNARKINLKDRNNKIIMYRIGLKRVEFLMVVTSICCCSQKSWCQ